MRGTPAVARVADGAKITIKPTKKLTKEHKASSLKTGLKSFSISALNAIENLNYGTPSIFLLTEI